MNAIFLKILNMSIASSWLILVVLILRFVLNKAPKWVNVLLWGIVAVRLICPFSIESALSLIPSAETVPLNIEMDKMPVIDSGIDTIDGVVNPVISDSVTSHPFSSVNPLQMKISFASILWIVGIAVMLLYAAISYWHLCRKVDTAVCHKDNIFQSENVNSPFVLGIIKPRIYLPFKMDGQNLEYVVAHEQAHIRRKDHWWKPLGFFLLTVHWFNPLMWLAYILLCRDIELACDEKIIKELGNEQRADYVQALVACSVKRRMIAASPLAFGEIGVKERVKSVMNFKKPTFAIIFLSVLACIIVSVCFLTNPKENSNYEKYLQDTGNSNTEKQTHEYSFHGGNEVFSITNGYILIGGENKFAGGHLEVGKQDAFENLTFYEARYYVMIDGEKQVILTKSVIDEEGIIADIGNAGELSGADIFHGIKTEDIEGNLWFELKTISLDGEENSYQVQLNLTEIKNNRNEEISTSISNSLIYREYEIGTEYSAGSIIEINKELLVQEISNPETILIFYNDEILWEKPFSEENLVIELEKTGYYGFYAKDEEGELHNIGNACMCLKSGNLFTPLK